MLLFTNDCSKFKKNVRDRKAFNRLISIQNFLKIVLLVLESKRQEMYSSLGDVETGTIILHSHRILFWGS